MATESTKLPGRTHPSNARHEAEVKKKADAFLQRVYQEGDVKAAGNEKDKNPALDAETLEYLIKHHEILELKKGDMMPSFAHANYGDVPQADGHYQQPIYAVPGLEPNKPGVQSLSIKTPQGENSILLVSEYYHQFDADYYRQNFQYGDANIAQSGNIVRPEKYTPETPEAKQRYEELLAYARQSGGPDLRIRVDTDASDANVGSVQSFEKHDYLLLNKSKLEEALASDAGLAAYKKSVDQEIAFVKEGGNNPEKIVADKRSSQEASSFFDNFLIKVRNGEQSLELPRQNVPISSQTLEFMARNGDLVQLKKEELVPSGERDPFFNKKDAQGQDIPIYLAPDTGVEGHARLMTTTEGKQYILVDEGFHKWTEAYAAKHIASPEDIAKAVTDKKILSSENFFGQLHKQMGDTAEYAQTEKRYRELQSSMEQEAARMGIDSPKMMVDKTAHHEFCDDGPASAISTANGSSYMMLNARDFRQALASDQAMLEFKDTIGHELGHLKDKDGSAANIANEHNNPALRKEAEYRADLAGSGPQGTHTPEMAVKSLEKELRRLVPEYIADMQNSGKTVDPSKIDLKAVSDWSALNQDIEHPSLLNRIAALQEEGRLMKKYEIEFEAANHHRPASNQELALEAKIISDQVMQEIREKKLPPAQLENSVKPDPASGASVQERIEAVKASLKDNYRQKDSTEAALPSAPVYQPATQAGRTGQSGAKTA